MMKATTKEATLEAAAAMGRNRFRAVVDIGSNSVRLVIYEGPVRAPFAICNEKALCGLGRDMSDSGELNANAVREALATLKRFRLILDAYGDPPVSVIATAAVREASDGAEFVKKANKLGFNVNIISGPEEAELAAYGVVAVEPEARGLVGDMGGGSLELVAVKNGKVGDAVSLQVGPLAIMRRAGADQKKAVELIKAELETARFLEKNAFPVFYTVGGAWRSLARIHMNLKQYPLSVLHHYELSAASAIEVCNLVSRLSRRSLEEMPGISKKRLDTLPLAAIALRMLLEKTKAKSVVVSSGGVREGLLYRNLDIAERKHDPLADIARFYGFRYAPNYEVGDAAYRVIKPLVGAIDGVAPRIMQAACNLMDIAAYAHPDLRGRQAFDTALSAPFVAVSHQERVWIALALLSRYHGRSAAMPNEQAASLLSWDQQQAAVKLGLSLRFVASLAPKCPTLLKGFKLSLDDERLVLRAPKKLQDLLGETPSKRLDALAGIFEAAAEVTLQ